MFRLIESVVMFISQFAVDWLIPLILAAFLLPLIQLIYFLNPWLGMCVFVTASVSLIVHSILNRWLIHTVVWLIFTLMIAANWVTGEAYFHLGALIVQSALIIILAIIPGVVIPNVISILRSLIIAFVSFSGYLFIASIARNSASVLNSSIITSLVVIAGLLIILSMLMYAQGARPWEIRQAQRSMAKILTSLAIIVLAGGAFVELRPYIKTPDVLTPINNMWKVVKLKTEKCNKAEKEINIESSKD